MKSRLNWTVVVGISVLVLLSAVGPVAGGAAGGESVVPWQVETHQDLETMAERYNGALDRGASPSLSGERVAMRVTGSDGHAVTYRFDVDSDGRIGEVSCCGENHRPPVTLELATSKGTVDYLSSAQNPVRAFDSVFLALGDVRGPGVAAHEGGYVFTDDWEGSRFYLRLTINEEGVEEEAGEKPSARVLDLRGDRPALRDVPVSDLDGDGDLDFLVAAGEGDWQLLRIPLTGDGGAASAAREGNDSLLEERFSFKPERVEGISGGDCDDDDDSVRPGTTWAGVRCDGDVVVGAGTDVSFEPASTDLYIAVEEEGVKQHVREDAKRVSPEEANERYEGMKAKEKANKTKCSNNLKNAQSASDGGENGEAGEAEACTRTLVVGFAATAGADRTAGPTYEAQVVSGYDKSSPLLYEVALDGNDGSVALHVVGPSPDPEPIRPITAKGVGFVDGIKWAVLSFLRGFGLF